MFQDFKGRPVEVFFGFSSCAEICPTAMAHLGQELDFLGNHRKLIVPILVSIDPNQDTPAKLAQFVKRFGRDIRGITGSEADIKRLSELFKPFSTYYPNGPVSAEHILALSQSFFLFDRNGAITGMLPPPYKKGDLVAFIAKHIERNQTKDDGPKK
jgi:protein SCO1/2